MSERTFVRAGWRARVGFIKPREGYSDATYYKIAPEGVAITAIVVAKPMTQTTVAQLAQLGDDAVDAAKALVPAKPDVIVWDCTAGSFIRGYGYDQELIRRIEEATKIPATTTTTAVVAALRKLGIKRLCLATPYLDEVNEVEKKFLEDNGFQVLTFRGLQIADADEIPNVSQYEAYRLAKGVDSPEADGIFVSCSGWDVVDIIERLERDLNKPVVTSRLAAFWHALQIARVREPIIGYGKLLREP